MTDARIRQQYGFGAARLCLSPPLGGGPRAAPLALREGLGELARARTLLGALPSVAVLICIALVIAAMLRRPVPEDAWLELVRVVPEPELRAPELVPEKVLRAQPPSEELVRTAPEPPRAPVKAPVVRPAPKSVPRPVAPRPLERPKLRIDPVASAESLEGSRTPKASPLRTAAWRPTPPRRLSLPRSLEPTGMPQPTAVASRPEPRRARALQRSAVLPPTIDTVPRLEPAASASEPVRSARAPVRARSIPVPARSVRAHGVVPASLAPVAETLHGAKAFRRVAFTVGPRTRERRAQAGADVAGIPLGSLAACLTDREENELKLEVLSVVSGRGECSSSAGRYRFVETRNLGAFLMWIERDPSRAQADRCVELRLALECLASRGQVGAIKR